MTETENLGVSAFKAICTSIHENSNISKFNKEQHAGILYEVQQCQKLLKDIEDAIKGQWKELIETGETDESECYDVGNGIVYRLVPVKKTVYGAKSKKLLLEKINKEALTEFLTLSPAKLQKVKKDGYLNLLDLTAIEETASIETSWQVRSMAVESVI